MKLLKFKKQMWMLLIIGLCQHGHSNGELKGGGGGVLKCPGKSEFYDLYEGRILRNYRYDHALDELNNHISEPSEAFISLENNLGDDIFSKKEIPKVNRFLNIIIGKMKTLNYYSAFDIQTAVSQSYQNMVILENVDINEIKDSERLIVSKGCAYEQLALYNDANNTIYIDGNSIKNLSLLDRVALLLHESLYRLFRMKYGHKDSTIVRETVSSILNYIDDFEKYQRVTSNKIYGYLVEPDFDRSFSGTNSGLFYDKYRYIDRVYGIEKSFTFTRMPITELKRAIAYQIEKYDLASVNKIEISADLKRGCKTTYGNFVIAQNGGTIPDAEIESIEFPQHLSRYSVIKLKLKENKQHVETELVCFLNQIRIDLAIHLESKTQLRSKFIVDKILSLEHTLATYQRNKK